MSLLLLGLGPLIAFMDTVSDFKRPASASPAVVREIETPAPAGGSIRVSGWEKPRLDPAKVRRHEQTSRFLLGIAAKAELQFRDGDLEGAAETARLLQKLSDMARTSYGLEAELILGRILLAKEEYREALKMLAKQEKGYSDDLLFAEIALCRLRLGDEAGAESSFAGRNDLDSPLGFTLAEFPQQKGKGGLECRILLKIGTKHIAHRRDAAAKNALAEAEKLAAGDPQVKEYIDRLLKRGWN